MIDELTMELFKHRQTEQLALHGVAITLIVGLGAAYVTHQTTCDGGSIVGEWFKIQSDLSLRDSKIRAEFLKAVLAILGFGLFGLFYVLRCRACRRTYEETSDALVQDEDLKKEVVRALGLDKERTRLFDNLMTWIPVAVLVAMLGALLT